MADIFTEASNNIRAMHEIESILKNDDIPIDSRSYFLEFINTSLSGPPLTPNQQKNVNIFKELFIRIDKDIRLFRTILNLAVDVAHNFKLDNNSLIYAFKNISLEEHFTNFVDFARRRNPIIEKNSPLQLFLILGFSIIQLAFKKSTLEKKVEDMETNKKYLMQQYNELSRGMSKRFINMDFGEILVKQKAEQYAHDLDDFNKDEDDDDDNDIGVIVTEEDSSDVINHTVVAQIESNNLNEYDDVASEHDIDDILKEIIDDSSDSGYMHGNDNILKTLDNGDCELNLESLDSLVMNKLGPAVISSIKEVDTEPIIRFNNSTVTNIVEFISNKAN